MISYRNSSITPQVCFPPVVKTTVNRTGKCFSFLGKLAVTCYERSSSLVYEIRYSWQSEFYISDLNKNLSMSDSLSPLYERYKYQKWPSVKGQVLCINWVSSPIYNKWPQIRSQSWITKCIWNRFHVIFYLKHVVSGSSYITNLNTFHIL